MSESQIPFCSHVCNPVTARPPARHNAGCRERCWAARQARRGLPYIHGGTRACYSCGDSGLSGPRDGSSPLESPCPVCGDKGRVPVPFSEIVYHPERLKEPLRWRKPRVVFVCSLGDLFHDQVSDEFRDKVFSAIAQAAPVHTFLVFTKRAGNAKRYMEGCRRGADDVGGRFPWPNVWLFVSCSTQAEVDERVPLLLETPAAHRGVSLEPLLTGVTIDEYLQPDRQPGIAQVIAGCESGPGRRPAPHGWFAGLADQCFESGARLYIKQKSENPDGTGRVVEIPPEPGDLAWRLP